MAVRGGRGRGLKVSTIGEKVDFFIFVTLSMMFMRVIDVELNYEWEPIETKTGKNRDTNAIGYNAKNVREKIRAFL